MHNPALLQHARGITNKVLDIPAIPSLCPAPPPPTCRTLPSAGLKPPPSLQREAESRASLSSWSPSPWGLCLGREVTTRGPWHGVDLVQHNPLTWGKCWPRFHRHHSSALSANGGPALPAPPPAWGCWGWRSPTPKAIPLPVPGSRQPRAQLSFLPRTERLPPPGTAALNKPRPADYHLRAIF